MFEFGAKLTLHDGMAGVMKKNIELQRQFREQLSSSGINTFFQQLKELVNEEM